MTEQRLSPQNPRELTANELDQVAGGASDIFFQTGTVLSGGPGTFMPTIFKGMPKITGSTNAGGNGGVENPGPGIKELGTTNVKTHTLVK